MEEKNVKKNIIGKASDARIPNEKKPISEPAMGQAAIEKEIDHLFKEMHKLGYSPGSTIPSCLNYRIGAPGDDEGEHIQKFKAVLFGLGTAGNEERDHINREFVRLGKNGVAALLSIVNNTRTGEELAGDWKAREAEYSKYTDALGALRLLMLHQTDAAAQKEIAMQILGIVPKSEHRWPSPQPTCHAQSDAVDVLINLFKTSDLKQQSEIVSALLTRGKHQCSCVYHESRYKLLLLSGTASDEIKLQIASGLIDCLCNPHVSRPAMNDLCDVVGKENECEISVDGEDDHSDTARRMRFLFSYGEREGSKYRKLIIGMLATKLQNTSWYAYPTPYPSEYARNRIIGVLSWIGDADVLRPLIEFNKDISKMNDLHVPIGCAIRDVVIRIEENHPLDKGLRAECRPILESLYRTHPYLRISSCGDGQRRGTRLGDDN